MKDFLLVDTYHKKTPCGNSARARTLNNERHWHVLQMRGTKTKTRRSERTNGIINRREPIKESRERGGVGGKGIVSLKSVERNNKKGKILPDRITVFINTQRRKKRYVQALGGGFVVVVR